MNIILMIVMLLVGFVLLVKGADFFVDGACALSEKLRIPAYVVGLTVVAFGTSLPEAAVSITASIQNSNEIAIGNVIGSNVFNTLVVLGASALFSPVTVKKNLLKRDFPFCLGITVLLLALMLTMNIGPSGLTRFDGIVLLAVFAVFMIYSVISGKKEALPEQPENNADEKYMSMGKCILLMVIGLAGVVIGGQLTVNGAKSLAVTAGLSEKVVALTVVAIGTSLPELVTSMVAAKKNQNDIAVGNVIGSNVFNILFILGISATIGDIIPKDSLNTIIDIFVLIGVMGFTYLLALVKKNIKRADGIVMILIYLAYMVYLLLIS